MISKFAGMASGSKQCAAMYRRDTVKYFVLHWFPKNDDKWLLYMNISDNI